MVERIYADYLEFFSARHIAEALNIIGIAYKNGRPWNKNVIYRILDDARYVGEGEYPLIICRETWEKVSQQRRSNKIQYMDTAFLEVRRKMVCAHCEGQLMRNQQNRKAAWWECKKCGMQTRIIEDADAYQSVFTKIDRLLRNQESIHIDAKREVLDLECIRLQREFARLLADPRTQQEELETLAKQITQLKYNDIDPRGNEYATRQILKILSIFPADKGEKPQLFRQIVSKVLVSENGTIQLKLINGQII